MAGSQDFPPDPRNAGVRVYVNGALVPRDEARVSVFDAGFVLGDGVWEGMRLHKGRLAFLDAHLDRLFEGARAIDLDIGMTRAEIVAALHQTLAANGMEDGVHLRLMVTRGLKKTPNQDPRHTIGPATVVIVAEWKQPNPALQTRGRGHCLQPVQVAVALGQQHEVRQPGQRAHLANRLRDRGRAPADAGMRDDGDELVHARPRDRPG